MVTGIEDAEGRLGVSSGQVGGTKKVLVRKEVLGGQGNGGGRVQYWPTGFSEKLYRLAILWRAAPGGEGGRDAIRRPLTLPPGSASPVSSQILSPCGPGLTTQPAAPVDEEGSEQDEEGGDGDQGDPHGSWGGEGSRERPAAP